MDINKNSYNARQLKLKQADNERVRNILASRERTNDGAKPYKNASNVFTHLVDDPSTRVKLGQRNRNSQRSMHGAANGLEDDVLSRAMNQDPRAA